MAHDVYISYAMEDKAVALLVCGALENSGIRCWIAPRDIPPGDNWGEAILKAVTDSRVFIPILSSSYNISRAVLRELDNAVESNTPIIPIRIEDVSLSNELEYYLSSIQWLDAFPPHLSDALGHLVNIVQGVLPQSSIVEPKEIEADLPKKETKGYIFISYVRGDGGAVHTLMEFLKTKGYAYWEYLEGDRDYNGALHQELEEKINGAAAFICIVTDRWRTSEWAASEYTFAKDVEIPIFVIQAEKMKRPMPLLLNQHTRIDMSEDKEKALVILDRELKKKGL
jgi:hypothetical protein